jgi:hypothetical protein
MTLTPAGKDRHNAASMPGFALFIGDHLARSVRGIPGAPPR